MGWKPPELEPAAEARCSQPCQHGNSKAVSDHELNTPQSDDWLNLLPVWTPLMQAFGMGCLPCRHSAQISAVMHVHHGQDVRESEAEATNGKRYTCTTAVLPQDMGPSIGTSYTKTSNYAIRRHFSGPVNSSHSLPIVVVTVILPLLPLLRIRTMLEQKRDHFLGA